MSVCVQRESIVVQAVIRVSVQVSHVGDSNLGNSHKHYLQHVYTYTHICVPIYIHILTFCVHIHVVYMYICVYACYINMYVDIYVYMGIIVCHIYTDLFSVLCLSVYIYI